MEFWVAAYRFGHSMIRPQDELNPEIERPIFGDDGNDLGESRPIPGGWAIDWQLLSVLATLPSPLRNSPTRSILPWTIRWATSRRIAKDPSCLALRNLERGMVFQLPWGSRWPGHWMCRRSPTRSS